MGATPEVAAQVTSPWLVPCVRSRSTFSNATCALAPQKSIGYRWGFSTCLLSSWGRCCFVRRRVHALAQSTCTCVRTCCHLHDCTRVHARTHAHACAYTYRLITITCSQPQVTCIEQQQQKDGCVETDTSIHPFSIGDGGGALRPLVYGIAWLIYANPGWQLVQSTWATFPAATAPPQGPAHRETPPMLNNC